MEKVTMTVTGMHCPKCEARVQKKVGALDGVTGVAADHEANAVELEYDGNAATLEAAKAAIAALDFVVA